MSIMVWEPSLGASATAFRSSLKVLTRVQAAVFSKQGMQSLAFCARAKDVVPVGQVAISAGVSQKELVGQGDSMLLPAGQ